MCQRPAQSRSVYGTSDSGDDRLRLPFRTDLPGPAIRDGRWAERFGGRPTDRVATSNDFLDMVANAQVPVLVRRGAIGPVRLARCRH